MNRPWMVLLCVAVALTLGCGIEGEVGPGESFDEDGEATELALEDGDVIEDGDFLTEEPEAADRQALSVPTCRSARHAERICWKLGTIRLISRRSSTYKYMGNIRWYNQYLYSNGHRRLARGAWRYQTIYSATPKRSYQTNCYSPVCK